MKTYTIVLDIGGKRVEIDFRANVSDTDVYLLGEQMAKRMGLYDCYRYAEEKEE